MRQKGVDYFCKNCGKKITSTTKTAFCDTKCSMSFHARAWKKRKREERQKESFPEYICKCGYKFRLDFDPRKQVNGMKNVQCPKCNKR